MNNESGIPIGKPISILKKSISVDFGELSKAIGKAGVNLLLGRLDDIAGDGVDALSALGLSTGTEEIAWLLVYRSLFQAMRNLAEERTKVANEVFDYEKLATNISEVLESEKLSIDTSFFSHPESSDIIRISKPAFTRWMGDCGVRAADSLPISERMPIYFAQALHEEWGRNSKTYGVLKETIDTPFTQANIRAQGWLRYLTSLRHQVSEPMLLESFSLKQVYIPLRGYYDKKKRSSSGSESEAHTRTSKDSTKFVVDLEAELLKWIDKCDKDDAIRLVSGGPGSGKSTFAKMLASDLAEKMETPVLYIPLHHFDVSEDLIDAVGKFLRLDGLLQHNPLAPDQREENLLIIFDGLDELAMQGVVAEQVAQDFLREVQRKVERFNQQRASLKILITGRELVIQANDSTFRKEGQILHVLPYVVSRIDRAAYVDPSNLLPEDQRQNWWRLYGVATGKRYRGLPEELDQGNLVEITAQPLLNYLVALSLRRGQVTFSENTNLNIVYADLLKAIFERGWAGYQHIAIAGVSERDFVRILEEIALASWHGDGRTTTVNEITRHCKTSSLTKLFSNFQAGLEGNPAAGITRLLTAFYFRQCGRDDSGEKTFEFTHKSFGEYLTAQRIVREIRLITRKLEQRRHDPDDGWDEREALFRWLLICGPSPADEYIFEFMLNEIRLQDSLDIDSWQHTLCHLVEFLTQHGMPVERLDPRPNFFEENRISRNAEEALLVALNACARVTERLSTITWEKEATFGSWLSRICKQRPNYNVQQFALQFLSFLKLDNASLISADLWSANMESANLRNVNFVEADCRNATFVRADLRNAICSYADFDSAALIAADLRDADLRECNLQNSKLKQADLKRANLQLSNLVDADLEGADLEGADLNGANLDGANLKGANLRGANFNLTKLSNTNFENAILEGASFWNANLKNAVLKNSDINGIVYDIERSSRFDDESENEYFEEDLDGDN